MAQSSAELVFLTGPRTGEALPLERGRTVLGRQVGDLIIDDREVSSIHAIISFERGGWYVMDLGSTNGVFVDEQVKLEARLKDRSELRVGQTRLRFQVVAAKFLEQNDGPTAEQAADDTENSVESSAMTTRAGALGERTNDMPSRQSQADVLGPIAEGPESTVRSNDLGPLGSEDMDPLEGPTYDDLDTREHDAPLSGGAGKVGDRVEVVLEVVEGNDRGGIRRFTQESILIGRLNTDLVVRDTDVSRRHAIIEVFDATQVYLRDLNSTNGTYVNGKRVTSVRLNTSDQIRLGRCLLRFSVQPTPG